MDETETSSTRINIVEVLRPHNLTGVGKLYEVWTRLHLAPYVFTQRVPVRIREEDKPESVFICTKFSVHFLPCEDNLESSQASVNAELSGLKLFAQTIHSTGSAPAPMVTRGENRRPLPDEKIVLVFQALSHACNIEAERLRKRYSL